MAFFGITIEKIDKIWLHPKAERLELASCKDLGFQFCIPKNTYKISDEVLYFPVDTILPEKFKEKLGIQAPGRIKTVQLRGQFSQGFVFPLKKAQEIFGVDFNSLPPEEITLFFQATKYEPPTKFSAVGDLVPLPEGQGIYDIENVDRYINIYNSLLEKECVITEKMEGTNISVSTKDRVLHVCQRANAIIEKEGTSNAYWEAARQANLTTKVLQISEKFNHHDVVVIGELLGPSIQSNIYKLEKHKILVFDIKINQQWLGFESFTNLCKEFEIETVPVLAKGILKT
nr:RNA ligase family protein [Pseudobdellovibrionaceae bacterium]